MDKIKYTIVEYEERTPQIYVLKTMHCEMTNSEVIKFLRYYKGDADAITVYTGATDEIIDINISEKQVFKYYTECDKSLDDYLKKLVEQLKKRGYNDTKRQ